MLTESNAGFVPLAGNLLAGAIPGQGAQESGSGSGFGLLKVIRFDSCLTKAGTARQSFIV
jgi:hypothetical protein